MSYERTLAIVRELSEKAILRPAPKKLRLATPEDRVRVRPASESYEELHPPRFYPLDRGTVTEAGADVLFLGRNGIQTLERTL